jgi:hypothetical protein
VAADGDLFITEPRPAGGHAPRDDAGRNPGTPGGGPVTFEGPVTFAPGAVVSMGGHAAGGRVRRHPEDDED